MQASIAYPSSMNAIASTYSPWDETSILTNPASDQILLSHEEFTNLHGTEGIHSIFLVVLLDMLTAE